MTEPESRVKRFSDLAEAVGFLAECLESDAPEELFDEMEKAEWYVDWNPDYEEYFSEFVFGSLREIHRETDLRELYKDREFPVEGTQFKLGGHMVELGCTHVDFGRRGRRWVLEDIWVCR